MCMNTLALSPPLSPLNTRHPNPINSYSIYSCLSWGSCFLLPFRIAWSRLSCWLWIPSFLRVLHCTWHHISHNIQHQKNEAFSASEKWRMNTQGVHATEITSIPNPTMWSKRKQMSSWDRKKWDIEWVSWLIPEFGYRLALSGIMI